MPVGAFCDARCAHRHGSRRGTGDRSVFGRGHHDDTLGGFAWTGRVDCPNRIRRGTSKRSLEVVEAGLGGGTNLNPVAENAVAGDRGAAGRGWLPLEIDRSGRGCLPGERPRTAGEGHLDRHLGPKWPDRNRRDRKALSWVGEGSPDSDGRVKECVGLGGRVEERRVRRNRCLGVQPKPNTRDRGIGWREAVEAKGLPDVEPVGPGGLAARHTQELRRGRGLFERCHAVVAGRGRRLHRA